MRTLLKGVNALSVGALLGMVGVMLGAFGSHTLEGELEPDRLEAFETAVRYQLLHSLLLVILGVSAMDPPLELVGLFSAGIILFSGSIYGLVLLNWSILGPLTPIGGTLLILGWGWLTLQGIGIL